MYTQCPDCDTAFRVTAEVLKQAAGKVRCGGCGNAFNALAYLSEQKPQQRVAAAAEPELPELKPEPEPTDEPETSGLPKSISAEQSAALLKTLDQLAGSDIRIEDTGIEWRVLDTDAEDANSMSDVFEKPGEILVDEDLSVDSANTSVDPTNTIVDEYLDDAPTPVDEFLTATPTDVDAGEIFEAEEEPVAVRTSVDELRFDDNTPLPEDFEFDEVSYSQPVKVAEPEPAPEPQPEPDIEELEVDLTLGEDDDWESLLDEVDDVVAEAGHSDSDEADEVEAPQATPEIVEVDADSDDPLDMDTQFAIQAEAMGIDLSGIHPVEEDAVDESSIEQELEELEALENIEAAASEPEPEPEPEAEAEPEPEAELEPELAAEAEPEPEAETEAELEPEPESALEEQVELELDGLEALEGDLAAAEAAIDASSSDKIEALELDEFEALDLDDFADDLDDEIEAEHAEEPETSISDEAAEKHEEDLLEEFEDDVEDALDEQLEEELEHFVPPLSEEEQTINMMIDQDLMALAMEDEDGFASTIVKGSLEEIEEEDAAAEKGKQAKKRKKDKKKKIQPREDTLFETIIMEGEDIRTDKERERLAAEAAVSLAAAGFNKQDDDNKGAGRFGGKWGMIAAAVILGLALLVQFVHQSRNTLATIPALNSAISPIYRMLGRPLSPEWDVTGWRFETTRGSAEESEGKLNIYSRLGNKSDNALPYPLIAVALTDRFEETIGSKVLEPGDYLADGLDPRKPVAPGNTFSAAISIETPTAGAASFKLNACYREQSGQLRCGLDDFR